MIIATRCSSIVRPAMSTPRHSLWTSNLDLTVVRVHMPTVHFYVAPLSVSGTKGFFDASVLKEALEKVLVPFYPVAGRLRRDEDGRIEIDCNGEGVLLVEAEADCDFPGDFREFTQSEEGKELVPKVDYTDDISSFPLLLLQVTRFKCGDVALGVGMHHILADGYSAFFFLKSWADMARGTGMLTVPHHDHTLLRARAPPTPSFAHVEFLPPPSLDSPLPLASTTMSTFEFTRAQLGMLKATCKDAGYSSFVMLAGHVWRCVCLARGLPRDQLTKLYIPVDARTRLRPELPRGYFGNAIFLAMPTAEAHELTTGDSVTGAKKIHEFLRRMDDEYLRSALDYIEVQPDLSRLVRRGPMFGSPNLVIANWARFPINEIDFGWGRPVFGVPLGSLCEGRVVVLPGSGGEGSLSLSITLGVDHMARFRKLVYLF